MLARTPFSSAASSLIPALSLVLFASCDEAPEIDEYRLHEEASGSLEHVPEPEPSGPEYYTARPVDALPAVDCAEKKDTGYVSGNAFSITVVTVDGKPVEVETANAYVQMQKAAAKDGVGIQINSGFRTMAEQQYLYNCYINCNCNSCNLAAKPGYSNHQSGHALDLNTANSAVNSWLKAHGGAWGFKATVPSEAWHYEWWGGGPPTDGPCGTPAYDAEFKSQSFPTLDDPPIIIQVGETIDGEFNFKNLGKTTWTKTTFLAPTPKDEPSPLADPSWPATIRAARVDEKTAKGEVGRFAVTLRGNEVGDYVQKFKLVDEDEDKLAWFLADPVAIHVIVIEGPTPPPEFGTTDATSTGDQGGDDSTTDDPSTSSGSSSSSSSAGETATSDAPATSDETGATSDDPEPTSATASGFDDGGASEGCGCRSTRGGPGLGVLVLVLGALRRRRRA